MENCSITFPAESNAGDIIKLNPLDFWPQSSSEQETTGACVTPALSPSFMDGCWGAAALWGSAGNSNPFPFLNSGSEDPWFSSACPNHQHRQPFSALVLHINYLKYSTDNFSYKMYVPHWAHYRTSCSWVVQFMPRRWPTWAYRHQKEICEHTKIHNIN